MRPLDGENTEIIRDTFIYLRTRIAIDYSDDLLRKLAEHFPHDQTAGNFEYPVSVLGFGDDQVTWSDGVVIRVKQPLSPQDFADKLAPAVRNFEASAIHDRFDGEVFRQALGWGISRPSTHQTGGDGTDRTIVSDDG
jgi:hypothetical protein